MPARLHEGHGLVVVAILERDLVGDQLIMQTGLSQSFSRRETTINSVDDVLDGRGDDPTAARRASHEKDSTVRVSHNGWRTGRQRALSRSDEVRLRGNISERVG